MFWNLENFFDWRDSGYSDSDSEFSSLGERRWTKGRFYSKCNTISKAILWTESIYGRIPDVVCFAEVENRFAVWSIANSEVLKKYGYGYVHHESCDTRGIDVALIYRKDTFEYVSSFLRGVYRNGKKLKTREILAVELKRRSDGKEFCFLVNHHPSKYGGEERSLPGRIAVMETLRDTADSLLHAGKKYIVAAGDFNDTPDSGTFRLLDGVLSGMGSSLHEKGKGTIRYQGRWELIDMIFVSDSLRKFTYMDICTVPFLMVKDSASPGLKPLRTYSGPRYTGGVSDHLPVAGIICESQNCR